MRTQCFQYTWIEKKLNDLRQHNKISKPTKPFRTECIAASSEFSAENCQIVESLVILFPAGSNNSIANKAVSVGWTLRQLSSPVRLKSHCWRRCN